MNFMVAGFKKVKNIKTCSRVFCYCQRNCEKCHLCRVTNKWQQKIYIYHQFYKNRICNGYLEIISNPVSRRYSVKTVVEFGKTFFFVLSTTERQWSTLPSGKCSRSTKLRKFVAHNSDVVHEPVSMWSILDFDGLTTSTSRTSWSWNLADCKSKKLYWMNFCYSKSRFVEAFYANERSTLSCYLRMFSRWLTFYNSERGTIRLLSQSCHNVGVYACFIAFQQVFDRVKLMQCSQRHLFIRLIGTICSYEQHSE